MNDAVEFIAFWRLWRDLGKAVWALWNFMHTTSQDSHRKGKQWENDFEAMCQSRGLCHECSYGREDCRVSGLKVQCKAIDRVQNGWIDLSNMRPVKANGGVRGYLRSEVDVVALRHRGALFFIPADWLLCDDGSLRGRVKAQAIVLFQDNWAVFGCDYQPPSTDRQLRLL